MSPPTSGRLSVHTRRAPPAHTRAAKPPPLISKRSSTAVPTKKSPIKPNSGYSKNTSKREETVEPDEDDMTGLPQFCATCEKQILTPGNSILYCSESCRKKDHNKPLHESVLPPESSYGSSSRRTSTYLSDDQSLEASPMRSPIGVRPPSLAFSDSSESSFYDLASPYPRYDSEATRYLSQFRIGDSSAEYGKSGTSYDRARLSTSSSVAPSLSHTPSSFTSASGVGRPLPRRGDPFSASFSSFSVDLITPVINMDTQTMGPSLHCRNASVGSSESTSTAFHMSDREIAYEKRALLTNKNNSRSGSLKQLFSHEAMQASPGPGLTQSCVRSKADRRKDSKDTTSFSSKY